MRLSHIELQMCAPAATDHNSREAPVIKSGRYDLHSVKRGANWSPRFNNRPEIFDLRKNWC